MVNVSLEGIMVIGAFTGVLFNLTFEKSATPSSYGAAGLVGVVFSLIHAVATVPSSARSHVVSGTAELASASSDFPC